MPVTRAIIGIENVVATGTLNEKVDLNSIVRNFVEAEYDPARFPGLVFRLKDPKTSTLVFTSGKMVCTGAKSEKLAEKAIATVVQRLKKGGVKIANKAIVQVQNIVASVNLGGQIRLEEVAKRFPRSMYEPEQFPGVIVRILKPKVVFLVFASGKLVCTGATKQADVFKAVNDLHTALEQKNLMIY